LVAKRTPIDKKSKGGENMVEKVPLIDRKHVKSEAHVKAKDKTVDYK
jgi:hypothetical protein